MGGASRPVFGKIGGVVDNTSRTSNKLCGVGVDYECNRRMQLKSMRKFLLSLILFLMFAIWLTNSQPKALAQSSSPYGVSIGMRVPQAEITHLAELLAQSGTAWIRIQVLWFTLQPDGKNDWDADWWDYLVQLMTALQEQGLHLNLTITRTPRWTSTAPSEEETQEIYTQYPPKKIGDWTQFITKLTQRLEDSNIKISSWEIENEIDIDKKRGFWDRRDQYVSMVNTAAEIIQANSNIRFGPRATILPSSFFTEIPSHLPYIRYWLEHIDRDSFDAINLHVYDPDDNALIDQVETLRQIRDDLGLSDKPIWITETNLNSTGNSYIDPDSAEKLPQRYRTALLHGVERLFWHNESNGFWGPGILIRSYGWEAAKYEINKPVFCAYKEMITGDPCISLQDILAHYGRTDSWVDMNGDGLVNGLDFSLELPNSGN